VAVQMITSRGVAKRFPVIKGQFLWSTSNDVLKRANKKNKDFKQQYRGKPIPTAMFILGDDAFDFGRLRSANFVGMYFKNIKRGVPIAEEFFFNKASPIEKISLAESGKMTIVMPRDTEVNAYKYEYDINMNVCY
jgi:hypothetical protein